MAVASTWLLQYGNNYDLKKVL